MMWYVISSVSDRKGMGIRPKPMGLPWDLMEFVPGRYGSLFFLLGPSNTILYTNLSESRVGGYVYGSRVITLDKHVARVRSMGVSRSGSLLLSGDEGGRVRVWPLKWSGGDVSSFFQVGNLGKWKAEDTRRSGWSEAQAHEGPVWAVAHVEGEGGWS